MSYVSKDPVNYFSYIGSLTTPPCAEEVVWIDFHEPIDISEDQVRYIFLIETIIFSYLCRILQLDQFRLLTANDDHLKNNFRPTQPLNNRVVYQKIPVPFDHSNSRWGKFPAQDARLTPRSRSSSSCLQANLLLSGVGLLLLLLKGSSLGV